MTVLGASVLLSLFVGIADRAGPGGIIGALSVLVLGVIAVAVHRHRLGQLRAEEQRQLQAAQLAQYERQQQEHYRGLCERYGEENAQRVLARRVWQGATAEMVREMYGEPIEVSTQVYKTSTKETWRYDPLDAKRFGLHIYLENGVCVGWKTPDRR